jgi:hypothetical protein
MLLCAVAMGCAGKNVALSTYQNLISVSPAQGAVAYPVMRYQGTQSPRGYRKPAHML